MQTVHPDGSLTRTVYDINNRPIVSQSEYRPTVQSSAGELEVSDSGGTRTVYDGFGRVHFTETLLKVLIAIQLFLAVLDAQGQGTYYGYSALGQLLEVKAPATTSYSTTKYRYDEAGNRVWIQDANGRVTVDTFDSFGRRIQRDAPDAGTNLGIEQWVFDVPPPAGTTNWNQTLIYTNTASLKVVQTFDARGRLAREEPQIPSTVAQTNVLRTQNPTYVYSYNRIATLPTWARATNEPPSSGLRRDIEEQRNDSNLSSPGANQLLRLTRFYQDGGGRLRAKATAEGLLVYDYSGADARGRHTGISAYNTRYPGTSIHASQNGTLSDTSTRSSLGSADVNNTYEWDALGRLSKLTDTSGGDTAAETVYAYEHGRLIGMRYPNGLTTAYQTDSLGDVERIGFVYKASAGLLPSEAVVEAYKANYSSTEGYFKYKRDRSGQRRLSQDYIPQTNTPISREFQHTYDPGHRLHREYAFNSINSAYSPGASVEYAVDLVGNRSERKVALDPARDPGYASQLPQATGYNYDAQDKVTGYTLGSAVALTYDSQGNVATHGSSQTYAHDWRNRLIQSGSVAMSYDPEGLRVRKTTSTNSTLYLVDSMNPTGYAQVLCEYQYTGTNAPAVQKAYTYGLDLVSHRLPGGATTKKYYSTDALGTTRFLTGTTGTTVATLVTSNYHYDAFGTLLGSSPTPDTAYLYTGEQWDGDVGAYYLRARWYHPGLGRFLERDSYEGDDSDPISRNRYAYAEADPGNMADPSGYYAENTLGTLTTTSIMQSLAATLFVTSPFLTAGSHLLEKNEFRIEFEQIRKQCAEFECDRFVELAAQHMRESGKRDGIDWKIICYKSRGEFSIWETEIRAREGFGIYGGRVISESGIHFGIIVTTKGEQSVDYVSDNNVILEPKYAWKNGYLVHESPPPSRSLITIDQAHKRKLGEIREISWSQFVNMH